MSGYFGLRSRGGYTLDNFGNRGWSYCGYTRFMKTAVSIPDPLFQQADALAHRLQISRSELYANALRAFVAENDEVAQRDVLDQLYAQESSALPAGAAGAQARIVSAWGE